MYINYIILFSSSTFVILMASPYIIISNPLCFFSVIIHSPNTFFLRFCYTHGSAMYNHLKSALLLFGDYTFAKHFLPLEFCYTHGFAIYNHLKSALLLFGDYTFAKHFLLFLQAKSRKCLAHCV